LWQQSSILHLLKGHSMSVDPA